jgi:basic membrane lipoprotein Med (substrate-binding protein (PBP1-ABC) superfamily)
MSVRKTIFNFGWFLSVSFLAVGCLPAPPPPTPLPTTTPLPTPIPGIASVCLVTDVGTVDDGTFNQYAYDGMLVAVDEFELAQPTYYESGGKEDFSENINQCIEDDAEVIITVGFLLNEATIEAAKTYPERYFIAIDQDIESLSDPPTNVTGIQFREDQAGFLVGALAALVANEQDNDVIAGVYGMPVPAVKRFRNGFEQGALYINPEWEIGTNILGQYHDSFDDTEAGVAAAQSAIESGAVIIFGAGGPLGSAGITYAAQHGFYVIGVDKDEYFTTFADGTAEGSEYLISSALKRVDRGVIDMLEILAEGRYQDFPGGENYLLDAALGGVGFAESHDAELSGEIESQLTEILQQLISGDIRTNIDPVTGDLLTRTE